MIADFCPTVLEGDEVESAEQTLQGAFTLFGLELAFPNFDGVPTFMFEGEAVFLVALLVTLDFVCPKLNVCLGEFVDGALFVSMPKTAVDEDAGAESHDGDVGCAWQSLGMDAVTEAMTEQETAHEHLGSCVLRPDSAHTVAALFGCHLVHAWSDVGCMNFKCFLLFVSRSCISSISEAYRFVASSGSDAGGCR